MKKRLLKLFLWVAGLIAIIVVLNTNVTTKQGINYEVRTLRIPLYLKILDFLDRHYNYVRLVELIADGAKADEERVMKIFEWTHKNIRRVPQGMPIMDDHVWYTIVRGYGVRDQSSDVFTTLCNYAGIDAIYNKIFTKDHSSWVILSFAKVDKRWSVFDPYSGAYFKNKQGELASIEEIIRGDWVKESIDAATQNPSFISGQSDIDYAVYLENLSSITGMVLRRPNIQSPLKRLQYEIKKRLR